MRMRRCLCEYGSKRPPLTGYTTYYTYPSNSTKTRFEICSCSGVHGRLSGEPLPGPWGRPLLLADQTTETRIA